LNLKRRGIDHCRVVLGAAVENKQRNISWSNLMDRFDVQIRLFIDTL